ncbi:MAG: hypothetical protein KC442_05080, partial [Thermomicrobiales bacterium]|nr:hypothetical protein [Thermomicrobiales bacterium]
MRRPSVAAAGFALVDGQAAEPDGMVFVAPGPDRWGRLLLACVEPGEPSARGFELAAVALRTLRHAFATHPGAPTLALLNAFAAANQALLAENRVLTTGRWERRICVGATAAVLQGREVYVAQAAPSQAILIQDQRVYAFPDIASWRGDYTPDAIVPESLPLGLAEDPGTQVFASEADQGDVIALCAANVGQQLGRDAGTLDALFDGALLNEDLEGSVDRLERLMVRSGIATSFAVVASVSRLGAAQGARLPRFRARREPVAGVVLAVDEEVLRPPRGEAARDTMIAAAERFRRPKPASALDDAARRRALAAPGAQSVRRYREAGGLPAEVRANLPRGPGRHVPARVLAVSLALLMAVGGAGATVGFQRDREARAHAALAEVDSALQSATANPLAATSMVAQAEQALAAARDSGADPALVSQYARALSAARDNAWNVRRLQNVQLLGALPAAANGGQVRVALHGSTLYVAARDLYELDAERKQLVTLLASGTDVAGQRVGALRSVSIDGGAVVASDGSATYVRDSQGAWQRQPLAVEDVGGLSE